jgi:hypothetical protein
MSPPPFLAAKIEMTAAEQGKAAQVLCNLDQKTPFDGKAKVKLVGLPPNATAPETEITAADKSIVFDVQAAKDAGRSAQLAVLPGDRHEGRRADHPQHRPGRRAANRSAVPPTKPTQVRRGRRQPAKAEKPLSRLGQAAAGSDSRR